jgi:O-antigen ligase
LCSVWSSLLLTNQWRIWRRGLGLPVHSGLSSSLLSLGGRVRNLGLGFGVGVGVIVVWWELLCHVRRVVPR